MDADGLTFACATRAEERAARRAGLPTALIGLGGANGVPPGGLVSFGLAGGLDGLESGTVLDVRRVVGEDGTVLWEGPGLGVPGARPATVVAAGGVVDAPADRRRLFERTGAEAVDLESGALARTGRLRGGLRVISDTPERTLQGLWKGVTPQGRYDWVALAAAFSRSPLGCGRAALDGIRALRRLTAAARAVAE